MGASVWVVPPKCKCGSQHQYAYEPTSIQITYNLSAMLAEAGFVGWQELIKMSARKAGRHILEVLDSMAKDPEKYRTMNPKNGWGDYDSCLQTRLRAWAELCTHAPKKSRLSGSL